MTERADAANRNTEETGARIRAREEADTENIERSETEERARSDAKIRENRKGRGSLQMPS